MFHKIIILEWFRRIMWH